MTKIKYKMIIANYDTIDLSEEGYVLKYSKNNLNKQNAKKTDQQTWHILGIRKKLKFGRVGDLIPLDKIKKIESFTFKNGNPKYVIEDLDFGTPRILGDPLIGFKELN